MKKYFLGFVFLIVGIIGVIFPVLPGVPFLILSAFFFGILSREKVVRYLKKFKNSNKDSTLNRTINYILIKYIHRKEPIKLNGKG
ncbi:DUF454 family protein [Persephonella sp.]